APVRGDSRLPAARAALRQSRGLMSRNLMLRIAFAAVAIPVALWGIYRGGWVLASLLALLGVVGTWEVYGLAQRQGIRPLTVLGLVGGPKLVPVVSPNKTWSGAIGGIVASVIAVFVFRALLPANGAVSLTSLELALVGIAVALFGQIGDVAESLLKREAGVKDSSDLIPGHGGLLDRLDSLYFAIPATALLYIVFQL